MNRVMVDAAHKLVTVKVDEFCTPETVSSLGEAVRTAVRSLGPAVGQHLTLYDVSSIPVSPPETIQAFNDTLARPDVVPLKARKLAFVTPSQLARLQLSRVRSEGQQLAVFSTVQEARTWLLQ